MPFVYLLKLNWFYHYCLKVALWWVVSNILLNKNGNLALGIVSREAKKAARQSQSTEPWRRPSKKEKGLMETAHLIDVGASSSLIFRVKGCNCSHLGLVSRDRDFKEYSQVADKTPCFRKTPCLVWPDMDCPSPLVVGRQDVGAGEL